jgi:putative DNA primase/helicase
MVEPQPARPAEAPAALLDAIFRRGKWARDASVLSSIADSGPPALPAGQNDNEARDEAIRHYALAALENQVRKVERAGKGTRNQSLNDAALSLGHLVAAGALHEAVVRKMLEDAARTCGLAKDDGIASVRGTITSALKAGMAQPTDLSKIGQRARSRHRRTATVDSRASQTQAPGGCDTGGHDGDVAEGGEHDFALTDLGNAERFISRHGVDFRWCPVIGALAWGGTRWSLDAADGLVDRAVHVTVRAIADEADGRS